MGSIGFEPMKALSQQIYSLSPLAARATPHKNKTRYEIAGGGIFRRRTDPPLAENPLPLNIDQKAKLAARFERATCCLQNSCSTN